MNKEQILGILRHLFTFIGGILVLKGLIDESLIEQISGGLITLIGTVWSIFDKKRKI
jgi:hypothetical protein